MVRGKIGHGTCRVDVIVEEKIDSCCRNWKGYCSVLMEDEQQLKGWLELDNFWDWL